MYEINGLEVSMQAGRKKAVSGIVVVILLVAAWGLYRWAAPARFDVQTPVPAIQTQQDSSAASKSTSAFTDMVTIKPPRLPAQAKATEHLHRNTQTDSPPLHLDQPLVGKLMADLEDKANHGDADAATQLWYYLDRCKEVASEDNSKNIESLQQQDSQLDPQMISMMLQGETALFNNCNGITAEQMDSRYQWLKQAAAEGNPQAQYFYATDGVQMFEGQDEASRDPVAWDDYKNTVINYTNDLSAQCDLNTLAFLEGQLQYGGQLFEQDTAKSLFYSNVIALLNNEGRDVPADVVSGLSQADMDTAASDASNFFASNCQ
ncbi:MAG: hypothetical protein LBQ20_02735 [Rhodanobacter sp.]|jgi:hypothetical protein|nr:hypothetical protein [Rhodanobacter sp.]